MTTTIILRTTILTVIVLGPMKSYAAEQDEMSRDWTCPSNYEVKSGLNVDFPHEGMKRAFFVYPPADLSKAAPVWVPLTGSVESTSDNLTVARSGANALMAGKGIMVIGPVRACANQDPSLRGGVCNGPGKDGWNWNPWFEGRSGNSSGDRWKNDEGPDSSFLVAMVKCVGTKYKLDSRRLYLGGISSGGTMTNRALLFRSDFWAGGMPISGEWYTTRDDGSFLSFQDSREAVRMAPAKIHQGRVGPFPLPSALGPMIVLTVWGGKKVFGIAVRRLVCAQIIVRVPRPVQTTSVRSPMSSTWPARPLMAICGRRRTRRLLMCGH